MGENGSRDEALSSSSESGTSVTQTLLLSFFPIKPRETSEKYMKAKPFFCVKQAR